jgi:hypothetical protein
VQLYFNFLCALCVVFFIMGIFTMPLMITASLGNMLDPEDPKVGGLALVSVANFGWCGKLRDQCEDRRSLEYRCILDPGMDPSTGLDKPCGIYPMKDEYTFHVTGTDEVLPGGRPVPMVREATAAFGWADATATLLFLLFATFFKRLRVDPVVDEQDEANITPADFAVVVGGLPRMLKPVGVGCGDCAWLRFFCFARRMSELVSGL